LFGTYLQLTLKTEQCNLKNAADRQGLAYLSCVRIFEDVLSCSFFVPRTVLIDTSIGRKRKTWLSC